jgi:outer membrane immunogenic protein
MKKYQIALLAASILAGATTVASAADLGRYEGGSMKDSYVPAFSWTGFYLGGHLGGAWGDLDVTDKDAYGANANPGDHTKVEPNGVFGGVTLGYNWQRGSLVIGLEGDLGYMGLDDNALLTGTASGTRVGVDSGLYGDGTVRLGVTSGRALFYAKGGVAFFNGENSFSTVTGSYSSHTSTETFVGWTAGGGVEYALSPAWSLKAEYQYFDFGKEDSTVFNAGNTPYQFTNDLTAQTVKAGLNYKFGGREEAMK